jgi:DNA-binding NarL/FixJ family response regulator
MTNVSILSKPLVLLLDDDALMRQGLSQYLRTCGYETLEAGTAAEAKALTRNIRPSIAVLDILLSNAELSGSGLQLARALKSENPALGIVLFSAYAEHRREVLEWLREGHRGIAYILKGSTPSELLIAIQEVQLGRVWLDEQTELSRPHLARELAGLLTPEERPWVEAVVQALPSLTKREQQTVDLLAAAHTTQSIAQRLQIKASSIEGYITTIYSKLTLAEMRAAAPHLRQSIILAKAKQIWDLQQPQRGLED